MIDSGRLFPHKTFSELQIRPEDLTVTLPTGRRVSAKARPAVSAQPNEYHLFADEDLKGWSRIHVAVRVLGQEQAIQELLPKGTDLDGNAQMLVAVSCPSTKVRQRIFLTRDADRPGEWYGELEMAADDMVDVAELTPVLARTTSYPESAVDGEGQVLATYEGALIGFGESIRLLADEPKESRGGSFKVTWENFKESKNAWRRSHANEMFYIDASDESPEVLLNGAHDLLKQILNKRRARGAEAGIKASVIAYIAHTTWSSLFLSSLASSLTDEEEGDGRPVVTWPSDPIKTKVLKRLLPYIDPERSDDDERLQFAAELYLDPTRLGSLLTKLHSGIQSLIKVDEFVVSTLDTTTEEVE